MGLLGILVAFVGLALLGMVNAGEKHVITVEENVHLTDVNHQLKCSNDSLVKENKTLIDKNNQLTAQVTLLTDSVVKEPQTPKEDKFIVALRSLEKDVNEDMNWISPESLYDNLTEKLSRKPSIDEYKKALEDMLNLNLLYHYIKPDPYMKGAKVKNAELDKIAKQLAN